MSGGTGVSARPVLIVFGAAVRPDGSPSGALLRRVEAAFALGSTLAEPLYLVTGGQGRWGKPEAEVMRDVLRGLGAPAGAIVLEPTARNTLRSAQACARLLRSALRDRGGPVLVVTSGYHMPRCVLLLRLFGVKARPGRAASGLASARVGRRWFWRLREVPAITLDLAQFVIWRLRGIH